MKEARQILAETLSSRTASNPNYSLRAFARDIGVSPQQLSNVINGQRGLSQVSASRIAQLLGLNEYERSLFEESNRARFARSPAQRAIAKSKLTELARNKETKNLELDLFKVISGWHHFALIGLIKISKKSANQVRWFSTKLGISETETALSLTRLEKLKLISKTERGWRANQDTVITDQGTLTEAVKSYHRQVMEKAIQAMSFQTPAERYGSTSTLPVRVKDVERAKALIQNFRHAFAQEIADENEGQEIYALSMHFFKLTQTGTKGNTA